MKKLIIWTMALVFAMTVSLAIAADPVKKEEKKPEAKPAATAPAEPAKVEEKAPAEKAVKKVVKKKKVKKVKKDEPKKEEVKKRNNFSFSQNKKVELEYPIPPFCFRSNASRPPGIIIP